MPVDDDDVTITELSEFEPSRVDGVGKGANGFPILMLKAVGDEVQETQSTLGAALLSAETEARPLCKSCAGSGRCDDIRCSKCFGTGKAPHVGESAESYLAAVRKEEGVAESGKPVPAPHDCPTCKGSGVLPTPVNPDRPCPDCHGTGRDGQTNPGEIREGFGGAMQEGDPREKIDKGTEMTFCDDEDCGVCKALLSDADPDALEKKRLSYKNRKKLPDSAFALPGRKYPIMDESHARNALARVAQFGSSSDKKKVRAAVKRRYPNIDVSKGSAKKSDGASFSGPNPQLSGAPTTVSDKAKDTKDGPGPGSPEWEGIDAETAECAALKLMEAAECIRTFAQREAIEIAAGEGNDVFDTFVAEEALHAVMHAVGVMAQMAFHEGLEAKKSAGGVQKSGRRLSSKSARALAEARDFLTSLLGDDDPAKKTSGKADKIDKSLLAKEIEGMEVSELDKVLGRRDKKLVSQITKTLTKAKLKAEREERDADQDAKRANQESKRKHPKRKNKNLVTQEAQGDDESASGTRNATGGAKSVRTEEEIEARKQRKDAKKALKVAKRAEKQAAKQAAIAKALRESKAEAETAVQALEERLVTVEKMAAPSTIVRTRPTEALKASAERDALEMEVNRFERMAKEVADVEMRREYADRAKAARARLTAFTSS